MEKASRRLRGNKQMLYIDIHPMNVNSLVVSHGSIRILVALAAAEDAFREGADGTNAYLYGNLDIPVIMQQPMCSFQTHKNARLCMQNSTIFVQDKTC